jgi:hypothetical protein
MNSALAREGGALPASQVRLRKSNRKTISAHRGKRHGLRSDERPLAPHLQLARVLPPEFSTQRDAPIAAALGCVIANVMLASWQPGVRSVFYSRDNNHYADLRVLAPAWYTRRNIVSAVSRLAGAGIIEEERTAPSASARYRSTVRATPLLAARCGVQSVHDLCWAQTASVILRDRADRRVLDPATSLTTAELEEFRQLVRDVDEHNNFLSRFKIEIPQARPCASGLFDVDRIRINPMQRTYRRVFNGNLQLGGRWYGPWWQEMPAEVRQRITIDGRPTVEIDFAACQLRLLHAHCGCADPLNGYVRHPNPAIDLYRISGLDREMVKLALLTMINSDSRKQAKGALTSKLTERAGRRAAGAHADNLLQAVGRAYPDLGRYWFTGIGLELQSRDAEICTAVQRAMRELELPVLSIHDGFITVRDAATTLERLMRDCWAASYSAVADRHAITLVGAAG